MDNYRPTPRLAAFLASQINRDMGMGPSAFVSPVTPESVQQELNTYRKRRDTEGTKAAPKTKKSGEKSYNLAAEDQRYELRSRLARRHNNA